MFAHAAYHILSIVVGVLLVLCVCTAVSASRLTCQNENGAPVDWFVVYKLPRDEDSQYPLVRDGVSHYYLDSTAPTWTFSNVSLNTTRTAVGRTLQQIYQNYNDTDLAFVMYNDHGPDGNEKFDYGHTKGDVAFNSFGGFWLVHSVPMFPPLAKSGYTWPHNALMYGQSFLCISLSYKYMEIIGQQFLYNHPWVYDWKLADKHLKYNPSLALAIKRKHVTKAPWSRQAIIKSVAGLQFLTFAKFTKFDADLYSDWVAPVLHSDLLTETWQDGPGKMRSECDQTYRVINIQQISISDSAVRVTFNETHDHSKWAVTDTSRTGTEWTCVGDINRQEHQKLRAGGTVCFSGRGLHRAFRSVVSKVEQCKKNDAA